jgi:hypothetical protein
MLILLFPCVLVCACFFALSVPPVSHRKNRHSGGSVRGQCACAARGVRQHEVGDTYRQRSRQRAAAARVALMR